jgi:hypothetical protein
MDPLVKPEDDEKNEARSGKNRLLKLTVNRGREISELSGG